jgi:hypothetical protein
MKSAAAAVLLTAACSLTVLHCCLGLVLAANTTVADASNLDTLKKTLFKVTGCWCSTDSHAVLLPEGGEDDALQRHEGPT